MGRLRAAGVEDITVHLDKGFFGRKMVRSLERLGVSFLLMVPRHRWLANDRGSEGRRRAALHWATPWPSSAPGPTATSPPRRNVPAASASRSSSTAGRRATRP